MSEENWIVDNIKRGFKEIRNDPGTGAAEDTESVDWQITIW